MGPRDGIKLVRPWSVCLGLCLASGHAGEGPLLRTGLPALGPLRWWLLELKSWCLQTRPARAIGHLVRLQVCLWLGVDTLAPCFRVCGIRKAELPSGLWPRKLSQGPR